MCGSYKAPANPIIDARRAVEALYVRLGDLRDAKASFIASGGGRTSGCGITKEARAYRDALKATDNAFDKAREYTEKALTS